MPKKKKPFTATDVLINRQLKAMSKLAEDLKCIEAQYYLHKKELEDQEAKHKKKVESLLLVKQKAGNYLPVEKAPHPSLF